MAYNETPTNIGRVMNSAKQKFAATKKKISENKTKIMGTALVVTTTAAVLLKIGNTQMNNFLKEKNLYDEYYTPDADQD